MCSLAFYIYSCNILITGFPEHCKGEQNWRNWKGCSEAGASISGKNWKLTFDGGKEIFKIKDKNSQNLWKKSHGKFGSKTIALCCSSHLLGLLMKLLYEAFPTCPENLMLLCWHLLNSCVSSRPRSPCAAPSLLSEWSPSVIPAVLTVLQICPACTLFCDILCTSCSPCLNSSLYKILLFLQDTLQSVLWWSIPPASLGKVLSMSVAITLY